ncbi:ribonuclease HII [Lacticaseibacillus hulanensis]|uniref:ribonuclease HII n=1 Tax=Lacticaseibacillus hulanensis TaxID=2493111 RepID=UPI000FDC6898|nr:ribonuclease HII [Lacticaseibacillus hulanensis]
MTTLAEYKRLLRKEPVAPEIINALAMDERSGAQALFASYKRKLMHSRQQEIMLEKHRQIERSLWPDYPAIAGIDEVGRGPLAGPVITAAVILDATFDVPVNDSKQLTAHRRDQLFADVITNARAVAIGVRDNRDIDKYNIYHATELAMADAVNNLRLQPDYLLVDAMTVPVNIPQMKLIKGDARSISIGAASIVAKVVRDRLMAMYDQVYPGYGFAQNAGYGTKVHLAGLRQLGITPIHRHSFAPVKDILNQ